MASHQPAHPIHEDVEFSAKATGEVDRLELWLTEYAIATDGSLSAVGPESMIKSCNPFLWKSSLSCQSIEPLNSDHTLIKFEVRGFAPGGDEESEAYLFASGQYHHTGAGEVPTENEPIPIRINGDDIQKYLDVAMIPDPDLLTPPPDPDPASEFRSKLHEVIALYFDYDAIRNARGLFNFYYSPFPGHFWEDLGGNCQWDVPVNVSDLLDTADVILYLHKAFVDDCKQGPNISSEIYYGKTLVHESGHGLFGLRDEYRICDSGYYPGQGDQVCNRNIWRDMDYTSGDGESACANEAPPGLEPSDCTRIVPPGNVSPWGNVWRIDPADVTGLVWLNSPDCRFIIPPDQEDRVGCIMGNLQHLDPSDFGPACLRRINFRYEWCLFGECMPDTECP